MGHLFRDFFDPLALLSKSDLEVTYVGLVYYGFITLCINDSSLIMEQVSWYLFTGVWK